MSARLPVPNAQTSIPSSLLLRFVDFGLAGAIFAVPLLMGGRQPLGQLALVALAIWVAVCWCLRQGLARQAAWVFSPVDVLLLAAPALVGLQLVPLPPAWIEALSPRLFQTLPLWAPQDHAAASLGVWNTLSLTPAATRRALVLLVALALLMAVTLQRVRRLEDIERLIRWVACSTLVMAVFALLQYLMSNGKFFWFYEDPYTDTKGVVKGSFTNPNHFAQFIALGVGPLIWWIQKGLQGRSRCPSGFLTKRPDFAPASRFAETRAGLVAIALGIVLFAGLMSCSRGGAMAIFTAAGICLLVLYRGRLIRSKTLLASIGIGAFVLVCLFIYGYDSVAAELSDFGSIQSLDPNGGRRRLWMANLQGLADFPLTGTGAASHRDVIPMYFRDESMGRIYYTHAENSYVQIALEAGVPGALMVLAAVGLAVSCCVAPLCCKLNTVDHPGDRPPRRPKREGGPTTHGLTTRLLLALAAVAAGLAASFVQAIADFVWYVPGCMVIVVVLGACAWRLWQLAARPAEETPSSGVVSRPVWLAAAGCVAFFGVFMMENRLAAARAEPSWHDYILLDNRLQREKSRPASLETLQKMTEQLEATLRWTPDNGRAQAGLADVQVKLFEHAEEGEVSSFDVRKVRDEALAARFDSPKALREWLGRAYPERWQHLEAAWRHAWLATRYAPLEQEGHLFLDYLSFFGGPCSPGKDAYIQQALKVRPFDGDVLFEAGREAFFAYDFETAKKRWHAAYGTGPVAQERLEQFLADRLPVTVFIETFHPDLAALKRMISQYTAIGRPDALRVVLGEYAAASERHARSLKGPETADAWKQAADAFQKLENPGERLRCLRNAVASDPGDLSARHALGKCLFDMGQYPEAEEHLRWCVGWKPEDKKLRAELDTVIDRRLRMSGRPDADQPRR